MDIRRLTETYAVSPMISPEDCAEAAAQGFTTLICNRPDGEVPPPVQEDAMRAAAEAAGLRFVSNPVVHTALTEEIVETQRQGITGSDGPALAYCASGTRSTIVWLLGAVTEPGADVDALLAQAAEAGYQLGHLHDTLSARKG